MESGVIYRSLPRANGKGNSITGKSQRGEYKVSMLWITHLSGTGHLLNLTDQRLCNPRNELVIDELGHESLRNFLSELRTSGDVLHPSPIYMHVNLGGAY